MPISGITIDGENDFTFVFVKMKEKTFRFVLQEVTGSADVMRFEFLRNILPGIWHQFFEELGPPFEGSSTNGGQPIMSIPMVPRTDRAGGSGRRDIHGYILPRSRTPGKLPAINASHYPTFGGCTKIIGA